VKEAGIMVLEYFFIKNYINNPNIIMFASVLLAMCATKFN